MGPNHKTECTGEGARMSGEGYNRVLVCPCGAEDHAPETTVEPDAPAFDQVAWIMKYESEEMDAHELIEGFAHLIRTGMAWTLQGHYGRTAQALIERGIIDRAGTIDQDALADALEAF